MSPVPKIPIEVPHRSSVDDAVVLWTLLSSIPPASSRNPLLSFLLIRICSLAVVVPVVLAAAAAVDWSWPMS